MIRRLMAGASAVAVLAACPSLAAAQRPPSFPNHVEGGNVRVHFDASSDEAVTSAQTLGALLEQALAFHRDSLGLGTPPADGGLGGDDRLDAYMADFPCPPHCPGVQAATVPDDPDASASSSWLAVRPSAARDPVIAAHELAHVLQNRVHARGPDALREATAEWAAARFAGVRPPVAYEVQPYVPLDCTADCGGPGVPGGYRMWPFFEHLSQQFGPGVVQALHGRTAGGASMAGAVDGELAARGSTLAAQLGSWAQRNLTGAYDFAPLRSHVTVPEHTTVVGMGADPPPLTVAVDHLSYRVVQYLGDNGPGCGPVTAELSIDVPGAAAAPALRDAAGAVRTLGVVDGRAATTLPFDTCNGAARVTLPNGSAGADGAPFTVNFRLARPAAPSAPPVVHLAASQSFRLRLLLPRGAVIRKGLLRVAVETDRPGTVSLRLATKPVARRRAKARAGRTALRLRVSRRARLPRKRVRLTLRFTPAGSKHTSTATRTVRLRRAR